jgi:hypothetical protein
MHIRHSTEYETGIAALGNNCDTVAHAGGKHCGNFSGVDGTHNRESESA